MDWGYFLQTSAIPMLMVLAGGALVYGLLILVTLMTWVKLCPSCSQRSLRFVTGILWSGESEDGQRIGGQDSYWSCISCRKHFKQTLTDKNLSPVTDEEWSQRVKEKSN